MYSVTQQSVFISRAAPRHEITPQLGWMTWLFFPCVEPRSLLHHRLHFSVISKNFSQENLCNQASWITKVPNNKKSLSFFLFFLFFFTNIWLCSQSTVQLNGLASTEEGGGLVLQSWPPGVQQPESLNEIFKASVLSAVKGLHDVMLRSPIGPAGARWSRDQCCGGLLRHYGAPKAPH